MIVQKIEWVHFHLVGSQCIKILLITNLKKKKKTISSLKSSVHDEPVWFSLDNLACSPVKRPLVERGTREREKRKGLFHPPPPHHPFPFPFLAIFFTGYRQFSSVRRSNCSSVVLHAIKENFRCAEAFFIRTGRFVSIVFLRYRDKLSTRQKKFR